MRCPNPACGSNDLAVETTREDPDNPKILERKRYCKKCGQRLFCVDEIKYLLPPKRPYKRHGILSMERS